MGLLVGEKDTTLTYQESKKYQKMLKKAAALQLTKLFKQFWELKLDEEQRLIHGTEQEVHLLAEITPPEASSENESAQAKSQTEFSVFLNKKEFFDRIPAELASRLQIVPEYVQWMLELIPGKPFHHILNVRELEAHLRDTEALNQLKIEVPGGPSGKSKYRLKILSTSSMPKLGHADFYVARDGSRISPEQRKAQNDVSGSQYFVDSTICSHVRFSTLTRNTVQKRKDLVEINVPIFIDKNTKVRYPGLYSHFESYGDKPYRLQEQILENLPESSILKQVRIFLIFFLVLESYTFDEIKFFKEFK